MSINERTRRWKLLSFKCTRPGCDFEIEDGEHVEDVFQKLQVHFRAQHPRVWLRPQYVPEEIERYNQSLEDYFTNQFGPNWQAQQPQHLIQNLQMNILTARNERYYSPELRREAQEYVNDNANAQQAAPQNPVAAAGVADDGAFPNPFRVNWANVNDVAPIADGVDF